MKLYKIEKIDPLKFKKEIGEYLGKDDSALIAGILVKSVYPKYIYWDEFKYKKMPDDINPEIAWLLVKGFRKVLPRSRSPIKNENGETFTWLNIITGLDEFLHNVDMKLGGLLIGKLEDFTEKNKSQLILRGVMEEAIASSQLEGASTTRKIAKKMLREGRKPKTTSEQMILNNYQAMKFIESDAKDMELNEDLLLNLHSILTVNTLDEETDIGKLRTDKDDIVVNDSEWIYHKPPKMSFVKKELIQLYNYANDKLKKNEFTHPIIKAIILHFWIGYLHPFADGNGRLARLIFYWYLLRNNYWGVSYLPLSQSIKASPKQYIMSYVYSEQDDSDLTYFIDFNIRKIQQAMDAFDSHIKKEQAELNKFNRELANKYSLNDRQVQLLRYLNSNKNEGVTIQGHMKINSITRVTAIKDLEQLVQYKLLEKKQSGRKNIYFIIER